MATRGQRLSRKQEESVAEDLGGSVQVGSGSHWAAKGDVRLQGKVRVECKVTEKAAFQLKLATILKIRNEALKGMDFTWVLQLRFKHCAGHTDYAILERSLAKELKLFIYDAARDCDLGTKDIYPKGKSTTLSREWIQSSFMMNRAINIHWPANPTAPYSFTLVPWDRYLSRRDE